LTADEPAGNSVPSPAAIYADHQDAFPPLPPPHDPGIITGPLRPAILRLALPAVGTTLFQVLFNITDTFWVGRTLGATALAAVSLASYSVWVMVSFGELVGVGLTAVAARRHGERDPNAAARATGTALALALVIQFIGAFLVFGYFVVSASFRSAGDTQTPFYLLGGSVLLNLVLDPVMILGWGPIPALGVYGAALATVLTRGLSFVVGLELLRRRRAILPVFEPEVGRTMLRIGSPTMLTGVLFSVIYMLLVRVVGTFGTPAIAALGVGHKIEGMSYMICIGFGLAAETLVGQNLGAGSPDRAREAGWLTARIAAVPSGVLAIVFLLLPEALIGIFSSDPDVIHAGSLYLRTAALAQFTMAFETVLEGALTGAGYTFWTMVIIVALSAIRIPLAALIAPAYGLLGVWWILAFTAMGRAVALTSLWHWGRWEKAKA
jgi:Na+-driven multidrug efflux pump